ncbi:MAG TPA: SDR family NAD(P)-dependent oxidoreductase [Candidatus Binatia bacterium]|nr:SDR family NAD(P)-dependent oxidoreductase [Candidatus Binatia bacterium]
MSDARKPACLIVGAGPGIGQAVACAFAREGFALALSARSAARLDRVRAAVEKCGASARAYSADAGDEASLRQMIASVRADLGDPAVLVYNAAVTHAARPTSISTAQLLDDFRVNVAGALVCAQEVAPAMTAAGRGTILLTGGSFAHEPAANYASLSVGKAALRNLTFSLAQELGAAGIHVATVTVYGFVQTGTHFDPARIAQAYLELHRQPQGHFQTEYVYK